MLLILALKVLVPWRAGSLIRMGSFQLAGFYLSIYDKLFPVIIIRNAGQLLSGEVVLISRAVSLAYAGVMFLLMLFTLYLSCFWLSNDNVFTRSYMRGLPRTKIKYSILLVAILAVFENFGKYLAMNLVGFAFYASFLNYFLKQEMLISRSELVF